MVNSCAVSNCKVTYSKDGPSLHSVPTDPVLRKIWLRNTKRSSFMPTSKVCSKHFTPDCFMHNGWNTAKHLRKDAVPTIFVGIETEPVVRKKKKPKDRAAGTTEKMALRQRTTRSMVRQTHKRPSKVQSEEDKISIEPKKIKKFVDILPKPDFIILQPLNINSLHSEESSYLEVFEACVPSSSLKPREADPLGASGVCNIADDQCLNAAVAIQTDSELGKCRTCGVHQHRLVDIYGNEGVTKGLAMKINKHLPIKVSVKDDLPLTMCATCVDLLEACSLIRESSRLQDQLFRSNKKLKQTSALPVSEDGGIEEQVSSPPTPPECREEVWCNDQGEPSDVEPAETTLVEKPASSGAKQARKRRNDATAASVSRPKKKEARGKHAGTVGCAESAPVPAVQEAVSFVDMEKKLLEEIIANEAIAEAEIQSLCCKECGESLPDECLFNVHMKHHKIRNFIMCYYCKTCAARFQTFYLLTMHKKSEHPVGHVHVCEHCGKQFRRKDNLESHINYRHKTELPYLCHLCSKSFALIHDLRFHIKNHSNITCNICNKTFKHPENLRMHQRVHKKSGTICKQVLQSTICPICNLPFKTNRFLEHHILLKHPNSSIVSDLSIRQHEKKFICTYCGASYTAKSVLMNHINTHTKNKTYKCKYCDKTSFNFLSIRSHEKSHSNVRPFACTFCDMTFKLRYGLNVHLRTHTGEKPYKCDICEQAFSQSSDLKRHVARHNSGGPVRPPRRKVRCEGCGGSFTSTKRLEEHECRGEGGGEEPTDFLSNVICDGRSVWQ